MEVSCSAFKLAFKSGRGWPGQDVTHQLYQACFLYSALASAFPRAEDPAKACIRIPGVDANCANNFCTDADFLKIGEALANTPAWNGGMNHLVFNHMSDWPNAGFAHGKAALVRSSSMNVTYRPHFDVQIPSSKGDMMEAQANVLHAGNLVMDLLAEHYGHAYSSTARRHLQAGAATAAAAIAAAESAASPDPGRSLSPEAQQAGLHELPQHQLQVLEPILAPVMQGRDLLLYFSGCIISIGGVCRQRREVFGRFPPPTNESDVAIIPQCCTDHRFDPDPLPHCRGCKDNMRELPGGKKEVCTAAFPDVGFPGGLLRARFTFAPRGCGPLTYRMMEAIVSGSVPVFTGDGSVLPFAGENVLGELFAQCVVVIPDADLPRTVPILRAIGRAEYVSRLSACTSLAAIHAEAMGSHAVQALCIMAARVARQLGPEARAKWRSGPHGWIRGCRALGVAGIA